MKAILRINDKAIEIEIDPICLEPIDPETLSKGTLNVDLFDIDTAPEFSDDYIL